MARAFDGKQGLFQAAVRWPWNPAEVVPQVVAGPKGQAGQRMAQLAVGTWEDPEGRATILALLTSSTDSEIARALLREFVSTQILVPFVRGCGFDEPELRGALLAGHHVGLVMVRYVLAIEPLASLDAGSLVEISAVTTQRLLTQPIPDPPTGTRPTRRKPS